MTAADEAGEASGGARRAARRARRRLRRRRPRDVRQLLILGAGWVFLVLGVLGLFLPVLQGILFLLIGLFLLSKESSWARWLRQWLRQRYPKLGKGLDEARHRSEKFMRRFFGGGKSPDGNSP